MSLDASSAASASRLIYASSSAAMVFLLSAILALPKWLFIVLAAPTCLWLAAYVLPLFYIRLRGTQDLKKKYGAEWALVTGGTTGIGRAIAEALAQQGLNVVVQGLEPELTPAIKELQQRYACQQPKVACSRPEATISQDQEATNVRFNWSSTTRASS